MTNQLAEATTKLVELLEPFTPEERVRLLQAALTLFGDPAEVRLRKTANLEDDPSENGDVGTLKDLNVAAAQWATKHAINMEKLQQYFHMDKDSAEPIALPGTTKKKIEQVVNTYLVQGVANLLATGDSTFTDDAARTLCEHFGCYDTTNHSKYLKEFGNKIVGSKAAGWKLTAPGLTAAAELIQTRVAEK
jgi:hypothetical protein